METPSKSRIPDYGPREEKKSTNLLFILIILAVLIAIVFAGLHVFGQRFGVPV